MKNIKRNNGFTVVEIMLGLVLSSILILTLFSITSNSRKSFNLNYYQNFNILSAKNALNQVVNELRYADGITNPNALNATTNYFYFTVNGLKRVIDIGTGTNAHTIQIKHYDTTNTLVETKNLGKSTVNLLEFTRTASSTVDITLEIKDTAYPDAPNLSASTTIFMPNIK